LVVGELKALSVCLYDTVLAAEQNILKRRSPIMGSFSAFSLSAFSGEPGIDMELLGLPEELLSILIADIFSLDWLLQLHTPVNGNI
jgi:hypothetical protein